MGPLWGPGVPRAALRSHQKILGITDRINVFFLRNVLARVLIWQLPEHKLKPSGVCGYVFLRNVLAQVLIWHLPEHELKPLGGLWGVP